MPSVSRIRCLLFALTLLAFSIGASAIGSDTINVLAYGAKGDGLTNDAPAINNALDSAYLKGVPVMFPKTNAWYYLTTSLTTKVNIYGMDKAEIRGKGILMYAPGNNITVDGIIFTGLTNSGDVADFAVLASGNNVHLNNCTFNNACIKYRLTSLDSLTGAAITNDTFNIDFSAIEHLANQNDVITLRGVQHGVISGNMMQIINCTRVIKLADNLKNLSPDSISIYHCADILITNNTITAATNSNKQVIDCYNGTAGLQLINNHIKADGFSSIIEDKTGLKQDFAKGHFVHKNTIILSGGSGIVMQGTYGSNLPGYESGLQNIIIDSNTIIYTGSSGKDKMIQARYFHDVSIRDNTFSSPVSIDAIDLRANRDVAVWGNIINNGIITLGTAVTNSAGAAYTDKFKSATISGNTINDFSGPAAIAIEQVRSANGTVAIDNNIVTKIRPELNTVVVKINNTVLHSLHVTNNSANIDDTAAEKLNISNSTIQQRVEKDNNWSGQ